MNLEEAISLAQEYLAPNQVNCIIYPARSVDGAISALSAWVARGDFCKYRAVEWDANTELSLKTYCCSSVLFIGCSINQYQISLARQIADRVCFIDNRKEVFDEMCFDEGYFFVDELSLGLISWHYFNANTYTPSFIRFMADIKIQDYDLQDESEDTGLYETIYWGLLDKHPSLNFREMGTYLTDDGLSEILTHGMYVTFNNQQARENIIEDYFKLKL